MPFTFSHPAIVLPLKQLRPRLFSTTGLVIGSLSPDLLYFLKMDGNADYGHTLPGTLFFDLPVTFLVAIIFHRWIKAPLVYSLPSPVDKKLDKYLHKNFLYTLRKNWVLIALSAYIGAISHILWDRFASPKGWVYHLAPKFFGKLVLSGYMEMYLLIEWIGSFLGLLLIAWVILKETYNVAIPSLPTTYKFSYWSTVLIFTAIITTAKLSIEQRQYSLGPTIIIVLSAGLGAIIITTLLMQLRAYAKK